MRMYIVCYRLMDRAWQSRSARIQGGMSIFGARSLMRLSQTPLALSRTLATALKISRSEAVELLICATYSSVEESLPQNGRRVKHGRRCPIHFAYNLCWSSCARYWHDRTAELAPRSSLPYPPRLQSPHDTRRHSLFLLIASTR
jgi:hypothetical protein